MQKITPCLWFDKQAEEAAKFYASIFKNSNIGAITHYSKDGAQESGQTEGSVMTVSLNLDGQNLLLLNGGPHFKFSEAISLIVNCDTQEEIDHFWNKLTEGGDPDAQQCGWLKDKFGLSWQITPTFVNEIMSGNDPIKTANLMSALIRMKKLDLKELQTAAEKN